MTIVAGVNLKASLFLEFFSRYSSALSEYTALTTSSDHTTTFFFTILLKPFMILGLCVGIAMLETISEFKLREEMLTASL